MTALALGTMLIGMVLGLRFRFVILPPVIFVGAVALAVGTLMMGASAGQMALAIIVFACALQLGYVFTALVAASVLRGEDKEDAGEKSRALRLAWKRSSVRHDMN
ncbi:hypothetical protein [Bradyrhizobium sp.]|uniref:hypothetical protein n=1 Tax=Bradyrhizobium sp. TaxID=376 RepID=UPI0039E621E6